MPERQAWGIFWICVTIITVFIAGDTRFRHISQDDVTEIQTADPRAKLLPVSPGATVRSQILPPASMDARWWVAHALQVLEGKTLRVRYTTLDNAPEGREVHWSSGLVWLLAALASVISLFTGERAVDCLPQAAFWAGPVMLAFSLCLLGTLALRRFGPAIAGILMLIFATATLIYQGFRAGEADHHGLVCAFAAASVLSLVSAGGGLVRKLKKRSAGYGVDFLPVREAARNWMIASGITGGSALWVSAASFIPILIGCGIGAVACVMMRPKDECDVSPQLFRVWGVAGCAASLFFYLLEYFPSHMGWRLEVNHPLYALAWLGAGDLLARIVGFHSGKPFVEARPASVLALLLALAFVLTPAIMIVVAPSQFFWVADKFVLSLHNECIQEFRSFPRYLTENPKLVAIIEMFLWPFFIVTGGLYLSVRGILSRGWQALLLLTISPATVMLALTLMQIRWSVLSMGMWAVCAAVLLTGYLNRRESTSKLFSLAFTTWLVISTLTFPILCLISLSQAHLLKNNLPKLVIPPILLRDVAHRLVQSSTDRLPVVLSGPGSSTELTYYAGLKTIGTFYWENRDGLKRAARMFAAQSEQEAKQLLSQAGITHIVVATWDDFAQPYVKILQSSGEAPAFDGPSFLQKILAGEELPDWLRPLYYPIPSGFGIEDQEIHIFRVMPEQNHFDALLNRGIYFFEKGQLPKAYDFFNQALVLKPDNRTAQEYSRATSLELKRSNPNEETPSQTNPKQ